MTIKFEKYVVVTITIISALVVVGVYVLNGAEKGDAWLYLAAIFSILSIPAISYPRRKNDKK